MVFGLVITYRTFGSRYRAILFFASAIFLMGVELVVLSNFDLLLPANFSLMTIFASAGGGLIILYISDPKNYLFLTGGILSVFAGWASIKLLPPIIYSMPYLFSSFRMKIFWVLVLIIAGILIWQNFKRDHSSEE